MKFDNYTLTVLHRSPLFRALEPDQFNALVDTAHLYTLNEGEFLFRQGDPLNEVFVDIKGFMKLFGSPRMAMRKWWILLPPVAVSPKRCCSWVGSNIRYTRWHSSQQ